MNNFAIRSLILLLATLPGLAAADTLALTGARVHTVGPQGTLAEATVVVRDGVIVAVGADVSIPADATRIDVSGKVITPGLFSAIGQIGLREVSAVDGTVDYIQRGDRFAASFDVADAFNPRSTLVGVARVEGVTRTAITPRSSSSPGDDGSRSSLFSGLGAVVHLGGDDALVRRGAVLVVNLGEAGSALAGGSRAGALLELRNALDEALDYAGHREDWERGARRDYAYSRNDLEALQDVIEGRVPVLAFVDRASDIEHLLQLGSDYSLRLLIAGGAEAWMLAEQLAAANVGVILDSVNNLPGNFDQLNSRLDAAAILSEAGVEVSFGMHRNMQTHNARNITQAAGIAVANGMTWEAALRAITLAPARFYGVDDTSGSIEPGKVADLVIWPDDPLELVNFPEQVYIAGKAVPMQSRQTLLRDRYLDTDSERPPAFRR